MKHRSAIINGIKRGEKAVPECKTISHLEAKIRIEKWLKNPSASTRAALAESENIHKLERVDSIDELFE